MFKNPVSQSSHELQNDPSKAAADEIERRNRASLVFTSDAAFFKAALSPRDAR